MNCFTGPLCLTVAYCEGIKLLSPSAADSVDVATAKATGFNFDIDIIVTKWLSLELVLVEFEPGIRAINLETSEILGIRHGEI